MGPQNPYPRVLERRAEIAAAKIAFGFHLISNFERYVIIAAQNCQPGTRILYVQNGGGEGDDSVHRHL